MVKVLFKKDIKLDQQIIFSFLKKKKAGFNFGAEIIRLHPLLQEAKGKKAVFEYVADFYKQHSGEIDSVLAIQKKDWSAVSGSFNILSRKYFGEDFENTYTSCLSIISAGPRFLSEGKFQTYYKHPKNIFIYHVIHETLHFLFYETIEKHFASERAKVSEEKIWQLSEIVNFLLQQEPDFYQLAGFKTDRIVYANLGLQLEQYRIIWEKDKYIRSFLQNVFACK